MYKNMNDRVPNFIHMMMSVTDARPEKLAHLYILMLRYEGKNIE